MTKKHTLLVVDDEPMVVQTVRDLVRREFRVLGATSAQEGIGLMQQEEVHIVMTDQRMPGMTGVEFLSKVRGEYPSAMRLLFTGYADIKAVIDAINQGSVYRYIGKPWNPDELLAILRQAGAQYDLLVERRRLMDDLQAKNQELEEANAELRRSDELKEAFIRVVSHELRTPLTIMLGLTELVRTTPDLPTSCVDWLSRITRAGERLTGLVDHLLQLLQAGRFERPLTRQSIDLSALIREAVADVRPFVEQRHQQLSLDLPPDLPHLEVEPGKICDSLHHLLLNAIKFTPDGGQIGIRAFVAPEGEAEEASSPQEPDPGGPEPPRPLQAVHIEVHDTGVGIEPENLPHVFEPFFTGLDVSRHSSGRFEFCRRGLGVGLTLVRTFIEMHGGRVEVSSEPGKGSTFTLVLPC